ncbi:MAG: SAM-dependent chlorinase/fluorinase [Arenicellales bacterium]|nr:SAM-dependent chlorinase/fluorinase [Arenicellales bacterium]
MIILFTDFGADDIYVGQVHAVLAEQAPGIPVIDLLHTAPAFDIRCGGFLLDALQRRFPSGSIFITVVDPGVGGERAPLVVKADGKWFVAPDNGLLTRVIQNANEYRASKVLWRPNTMSQSFHGRDLFAPVAAMLASGGQPEQEACEPTMLDWPEHLDSVIYIDHFGNAITGRSGDSVHQNLKAVVGERELSYARVFCERERGELFWYVNSIGLVEIAANCADAARLLNLKVGDAVDFV